MNLSVAVLAGGQSRRMGSDKAMVTFDGEPLVVRVASRLKAVSDDVFVVAKSALAIDVPVVGDTTDEQSPLAGVITALRAARHPRVFVCACDMPFVDTELVARLVGDLAERDAVVPSHHGRIEPLHAVWSVACLPQLEQLWDSGERAVHRALRQLGARVVDVTDPRSFTNVNTPDEFSALSAPRQPPPSS